MKRNAFFQLVHKEDGVYLKSYPPLEGGAPLTAEDVVLYFDRKKIMDVNLEDVIAFVKMAEQEKNAEMKILPGNRLPENEFPIITIDKERRLAKIRLYPPSSKGSRLSLQDLKSLVEQNGVKSGIIEANLKILLKGRLYCTDVLLAKAQPPIQGHDAQITYHFNVDKTCKPAMDEDGNVDFHKLDMIEEVSEGQLLASLVPADFGTPGVDVTGGPIKPRKVDIKILKHGKNIHLSEDKLEMYSDVSGNVTLVEDTVFVSNQYEVPADVGASTGDIDYDGSVLVKGNVLTGYSIKATGDIVVNGVVEGAKLVSDGKIVLKRGIQGMGKAELTAKGDVITNFIESAVVNSDGKIMTDAIMHSQIVAKDDIVVKGKRGLIAGGSVRTKTRIEAKTIGSTMGTATEVEVGIDPKITERYHAIEKEMESFANEKDNLLQNLKILKKRLDAKGQLDEEKMKNLKSTSERIGEIDKLMEERSEEYDALGEELEKTSDGRIIAHNIVYPGVTMTISSITNHIKTETQHSAFVRDGADIRIRAI
jgi:hypothetical protein